MSNKFKKITEIKENDFNSNLFTFDIDWVEDFVLEVVLDILDKYNVKSTFFVTHESDLISQLKINNNVDCGIHPNFNPLLNGDFRYGKNAQEVLEYYLKMVPNATSIRAHSVCECGNFSTIYEKLGIEYDSNVYIPHYSDIEPSSWKVHNKNIIKVPITFADDELLVTSSISTDLVKQLLNKNGLKVLDFHPIHIFLNSENIERYNNTRPYLNNYDELKKHINKNAYGVKDLFIDIIEEMLKND